MKLIKAIINTERLEEVRSLLISAGILGMTASECVGHGKQPQTAPSLRCDDKELPVLRAMTTIEVAVVEDDVGAAMRAIRRGAGLGRKGDGKLFVSPLERVVRIRTAEIDHAALAGNFKADLFV